MPVISGKSAGDQNIAKAGVNLVENFATLAAATTFISRPLQTPGLPKLTFMVTQTAGALGISLTPQVAWRRGALVANVSQLQFVGVGPAVLTVPGVPTVLEFNIPAEAMRISLTTAAVFPAPNAFTVVLMASG